MAGYPWLEVVGLVIGVEGKLCGSEMCCVGTPRTCDYWKACASFNSPVSKA